MRNLYLLLGLLIITAFKAEAKHQFEFLEGKFINPYFGEQIKVKSIRGGVRIKGLNGKRGWQRFYNHRGKLLRPKYGRVSIDVVGPHRIIVKSNRWSRGIHFIRKPRRGHSCNMTCCTTKSGRNDRYDRYDRYHRSGGYNDYYDRNWNNRYDYDDRYNQRNNQGRNNRSRDFSLDQSSLIGEWYSNDLRKLVIIEKFGNEGIKARVSGGKKWTNYNYNGRTWIDDRGNTYRLEDQDTLIWRSRNGKEEIRLFRS